MTTILAVILRAIKHAINHGSQGLCWIKRVLRHTLFFKLDYERQWLPERKFVRVGKWLNFLMYATKNSFLLGKNFKCFTSVKRWGTFHRVINEKDNIIQINAINIFLFWNIFFIILGCTVKELLLYYITLRNCF